MNFEQFYQRVSEFGSAPYDPKNNFQLDPRKPVDTEFWKAVVRTALDSMNPQDPGKTEFSEEDFRNFIERYRGGPNPVNCSKLLDTFVQSSKSKTLENKDADPEVLEWREAGLFAVAWDKADVLLERLASLMYSNDESHFLKSDLPRLGYLETAGIELFFKYSPLLVDRGDRYEFSNAELQTYLWTKATKRELVEGSQCAQRDSSGRYSYASPVAAWERAASSTASGAQMRTVPPVGVVPIVQNGGASEEKKTELPVQPTKHSTEDLRAGILRVVERFEEIRETRGGVFSVTTNPAREGQITALRALAENRTLTAETIRETLTRIATEARSVSLFRRSKLADFIQQEVLDHPEFFRAQSSGTTPGF